MARRKKSADHEVAAIRARIYQARGDRVAAALIFIGALASVLSSVLH